MATTLNTPIVVTNTATTVQITALVNNVEEERVEIHYMTKLEDGTPYQRGNIQINGKEDVKAMYAELDALISTGKTFEAASGELLYSKVLAKLAE